LQITNIQSDRDSLAQQLENNKVVISELQTLLKSKDEEIQQLSNRVEDLNDETQVEINNEVERLKEQHKEVVEEYTLLETAMTELKADQERKLQEVEKQKNELQTHHNKAVMALENLQKKKGETDKQLKETEQKVSELQALETLQKINMSRLIKMTQQTVTNLE
ncbi:hypothetical protein F5050DRAFT_1716784, partial [Lentinula boryana]